jgi:hypothetical protein
VHGENLTPHAPSRVRILSGAFTLFFNDAVRAQSGCVSEHAAGAAREGASAVPAELICFGTGNDL